MVKSDRLLVVGGFVTVLIKAEAGEAWILWNYMGGLFTFVLYLWAASQACRFFVEARRSGLLELLLATPVSSRQIVSGQWRALLWMFGLPAAMLLGVHVTGSALSQLGFQRLATRASAVASSAFTNQSGTITGQTYSASSTVVVPTKSGTNAAPTTRSFQFRATPQQVGQTIAAAAAAGISTVANLMALCWFGMWMGMTSRSANLATLKTILFVQVIPWFVIAFGTNMVVGLVMSGLAFRGSPTPGASFFAWWPLLSALLAAGVAVAKDIGFIVWSRNKLHSSLREEAARSLGQPRFVVPRPLPVAAAAPPVIAAP